MAQGGRQVIAKYYCRECGTECDARKIAYEYNTMSLPGWVENELSRWTSKHGKGYLNVFKALEIAWEALEEIDYQLQQQKYGSAKISISEALRRIEELGK